MNISHNQVDELNAVLTISIEQKDYQEKVDTQLKDYQKKANIPGFRPGKAPMNFIKKQYEKALRFEEINKILQKELFDYLANEKIEYLGQPMPKPKDDIDWAATSIDFDFEIGLSPNFEIDLSKAKIDTFKVEASENDMKEVVERLLKEQGEAEESETISENSFFTVKVNEINTEEPKISQKTATIFTDSLKNKTDFIGKKIEDVVVIKAQDLFEDGHKLQHSLGLSHEDSHDFNGELEIKIETIKTVKPAEFNQDFYAKLFPTDEITNEDDFYKKLKEELEKQYQKDTEMYFLNQTTEWLMTNISFDLPKEFLINYFQNSGEKPMTKEEAEKEFERSEKGIKYQLIEGKVAKENNINIELTDILAYAKESMKNQLAMYGYKDVTEEELENFAKETLKNQEQIRRFSDEILKEKLVQLFNEKISKNEIKTDYKGFIKVIEEKEHKH